MTSANGLNHEFGISGALVFEESPAGLLLAKLSCAAGSADVCLQGGHVFSWNLKGQFEPVLWLSRDAKFAAGKSIRGGIPVCWPWFGPYEAPTLSTVAAPQLSAAAMPAHGFARTATWDIADSGVTDDGAVWLTLALPQTAMPAAMWAHATALRLTVRLGATLQVSLSTSNTGAQPFVLGEALHTYFNISDIAKVSVGGLHGVAFWDTVGQVEKKTQNGPIAFSRETDRVYVNSPHACVIEDLGYARRIHIQKSGSLSTVVWNPWTAKAERMGDLGQPDGWRQMLCVESANAWDNRLTLAPGETHTLTVEYAVETL